MRVADAFAAEVDFGEIRLGESALMQRFGMSESVLPKVFFFFFITLEPRVE